MSIVEVKCPHCGSVVNQEGNNPNEYTCSHCGTAFRLVDNTRRTVTVTKDVMIRGCLFCGKPLDAGKGYRCTRCGREYFCESCVDLVKDKYVCIECIAKAQESCQLCKKHAVYKCVSCGRRACKEHPQNMGFSTIDYSRQDQLPNGKVVWSERVLFCPKCQGFVCGNCAKPKFFSGLHCPKCDAGLIYYSPYR